jgi:hypothetical protein
VICGGLLFAVEERPQSPRQWEQWLATRTTVTTTMRATGTSERTEPRLIHADCRYGSGPALRNAYEPLGLA